MAYILNFIFNFGILSLQAKSSIFWTIATHCSLTSLVSKWIIQHSLWMQYSTYPLTTQGKFPEFLPQKTKIPYRRYSPPGGSTATPLRLGPSSTHSFLLRLSDCMSLFLSWWFSLVFSAALPCAFTLCFIPLYFVCCLWIPVRLHDGLRQFLFCFSGWENSLVPLWEED